MKRLIAVVLMASWATAFDAAVAFPSEDKSVFGFFTGQALKDKCRSEESDYDYIYNQAFCLGYILGVSDTFSCERRILDWGWSPPPNVKAGQLVRAVLKYFDSHPELLDHSAAGVTVRALSDAFPCP